MNLLFVQIPPESLIHIGLFGYDLIKDDGDFAWYASPYGRVCVEKAAPRVVVEDISDAIQLGAIGIFIGT